MVEKDIMRYLTQRVAVYGTLRQTLENHERLAHAEFLGYETLYDIRCFDLGWFPGAKCWPSEQGVVCEVYAVNDRTLKNLDYLEGYRPHQPERSTYVRKALNTRFGEAWLYEYQGNVDNCPEVQDYVAYRDRLDANSLR